jgi:hypothetical protein
LEDFYQKQINNQNPVLELDLPKGSSSFDYKIFTKIKILNNEEEKKEVIN